MEKTDKNTIRLVKERLMAIPPEVEFSIGQYGEFTREELITEVDSGSDIGRETSVREKKIKPKEFKIFINAKLTKISNTPLRKEAIQNSIIHELLQVENEDLFTIAKEYNRRKKKKLHVNDFEQEVFSRYNQLRRSKGIMPIEKKEHLDIAIQRILESTGWNGR